MLVNIQVQLNTIVWLQALQDWRSFRANLVALERANAALTAELSNTSTLHSAWVHELTQPEAGCLLLAKLESMGPFTHAAVLLCQHGKLPVTLSIVDSPAESDNSLQTCSAVVASSSTCHLPVAC